MMKLLRDSAGSDSGNDVGARSRTARHNQLDRRVSVIEVLILSSCLSDAAEAAQGGCAKSGQNESAPEHGWFACLVLAVRHGGARRSVSRFFQIVLPSIHSNLMMFPAVSHSVAT